jgi:hypothetical protein
MPSNPPDRLRWVDKAAGLGYFLGREGEILLSVVEREVLWEAVKKKGPVHGALFDLFHLVHGTRVKS